jgi:hypothetical protein
MTWLLLRVSGVALLEKTLETRPGYKEYMDRTSAFIPWFPRKNNSNIKIEKPWESKKPSLWPACWPWPVAWSMVLQWVISLPKGQKYWLNREGFSLVDLYAGFTLFSRWIAFRQKSWLPAVVWVTLMLVLGFWTCALYTLIALQISGDDWKRFCYSKQNGWAALWRKGMYP